MSKKRKLDEHSPVTGNGTASSGRVLTAFEAARARLQAAESTEQVLNGSRFDEGDSPHESHDEDRSTSVLLESVDVDRLRQPGEDQKVITTWTASADSVLRSDKTSVTLRLKYQDRLTNVGNYAIRVIRGRVSLSGAELSSRHPIRKVVACTTQALPVIVCISTAGADIMLSSFRPPVTALARVSPLYRAVMNAEESQNLADSGRSFDRIYRYDQDPLGRPLSALRISEDVQGVLDRISDAEPQSVTLVAGPKASGKSTFTRLLVNCTLSRNTGQSARQPGSKRHCVFLLDLDHRNPEYTTPGQISLVELSQGSFEPSHARTYGPDNSLRRVLRAHAMFEAAQEVDPSYFEDCITDLLALYAKATQSKSTLIINTNANFSTTDLPGLSSLSLQVNAKSIVLLGLDQTYVNILRDVQPTARESKVEIFTLPSQGAINNVCSEQQLQAMQTLSYFHELPTASYRENPAWDSTVLQEMPRHIVGYGGNLPGFLGIIVLSSPTSPLTHLAIEGSILTIVATEDPTFTSQFESVLRTASDELPYITKGDRPSIMPDPTCSHVVGIAFLARIDRSSRKLELVVPRICDGALSNHKPENLILIHGCHATPNWALKESMYATRYDVATKSRALDGRENRSATLQSMGGEPSHETSRPWIMGRAAFAKMYWGNIELERTGVAVVEQEVVVT